MTKAAGGERERRAYLAHTRQELLALITALVGYGEMLAEEARQLDLENVLPDLERILTSARDLLEPVDQLLDVEGIASRQSVSYRRPDELTHRSRPGSAVALGQPSRAWVTTSVRRYHASASSRPSCGTTYASR